MTEYLAQNQPVHRINVPSRWFRNSASLLFLHETVVMNHAEIELFTPSVSSLFSLSVQLEEAVPAQDVDLMSHHMSVPQEAVAVAVVVGSPGVLPFHP